MDSAKVEEELAFDFPPFIRVYKDGRVERLVRTEIIPPSLDPATNVLSKDVVIDPQTGVYVRLYLPQITNLLEEKLPLVVYFHGGGFCIGSASCPPYHNYLNLLASQAKVVVVSVDYRRVPEYPLPIAYDDSWAALQWVASHSSGSGPESWLNDHAGIDRVFFGGDSAGANIAHNMGMQVNDETQLPVLGILGIFLIHPYFWGTNPVGSEVNHVGLHEEMKKNWSFICPSSSGLDDPRVNPAADTKLSGLGCTRVLVCVGEKDDALRERGWFYYETLKKSGWGGKVEFMESEGEGHVFYLFNPTCDKALELMHKVVLFINQD